MSTLPLLIIGMAILCVSLYLTRDKRTPEERRNDEIDRLPVSDEIKRIMKMSEEEIHQDAEREAQEFHDILLQSEISRALVKRQFYKSLYNMSEDDVERATQNFFRRMGITNKDMVRLGFNPIVKETNPIDSNKNLKVW